MRSPPAFGALLSLCWSSCSASAARASAAPRRSLRTTAGRPFGGPAAPFAGPSGSSSAASAAGAPSVRGSGAKARGRGGAFGEVGPRSRHARRRILAGGRVQGPLRAPPRRRSASRARTQGDRENSFNICSQTGVFLTHILSGRLAPLRPAWSRACPFLHSCPYGSQLFCSRLCSSLCFGKALRRAPPQGVAAGAASRPRSSRPSASWPSSGTPASACRRRTSRSCTPCPPPPFCFVLFWVPYRDGKTRARVQLVLSRG